MFKVNPAHNSHPSQKYSMRTCNRFVERGELGSDLGCTGFAVCPLTLIPLKASCSQLLLRSVAAPAVGNLRLPQHPKIPFVGAL